MNWRNLFLGGLITALSLTSLMAQEKQEVFGWTKQLITSLNITQNNYSNWAAGGENALAYTLTLDTKFQKNEVKYNWTSTGKFAFGQTKQGDAETKIAVDRVNLETVFIYKLGVYVNPYLAGTFDSQFTKGYDYSRTPKLLRSNFMNPAYITQSAGAGFNLLPKLKTRLGLSFKETVTRRDYYAGFYTDDKTTPEIERTRFETGIESVTDFEAKLAENLLYVTKLGLFSSFEHITEVDVKWDNTWTAKVSKYLAVNLNVYVFYDKNILDKAQVKEALAIGITYSVF